MKLLVCSVYDNAVGAFLQPFFQRSRAEALRSFKAAANSPEHNFHQYAGDYSLFILGEFDEDTGRFVQYEAHDNLGTALEHIDKSPQPGQMSLVGD